MGYYHIHTKSHGKGHHIEPIIDDDGLEELYNQCGGCFGHDYQPTFNGEDTYFCTICHKEIDMTED